ncbi:MAG: hypothetical protein ABSH28_01810 [Acidobacteriota bacterium]|jgi:hypothetical protein
MRKCCWILKPATWDKATETGRPDQYCGTPVSRFKIAVDDDGRKHREYDYLCVKHRAEADLLPCEED